MTQAENLREQAKGYRQLAEAARAVASSAYNKAQQNIRVDCPTLTKGNLEAAESAGKQAAEYDRKADRLETQAARLEGGEDRPWWSFLPIPAKGPE